MAAQLITAPDDLDLARRCAEGERAAQHRLFDAHRALVHATLYRILGSNREIEDLVQETFIQIFRSLAGFRGEAKLSTWIARIATRVAFAHISSKKPAFASLEVVPDPPGSGPSAEQDAMAREAVRRLYRALERLDAKYRIAFALHVIDGRPLREVAELTEASLVATKSRVWRARREINKRARKDPLLASYLREQDPSP